MNVGERETYIGLQLDVLRHYYVYVLYEHQLLHVLLFRFLRCSLAEYCGYFHCEKNN